MKGNKFVQPLNCTLSYHLRLDMVKCQFYVSHSALSALLYTFLWSLPNANTMFWGVYAIFYVAHKSVKVRFYCICRSCSAWPFLNP